MRHYSRFDQIISRLEDAVHSIAYDSADLNKRPTPKPILKPISNQNPQDNSISLNSNTNLSDVDRKLSLNCMRVNHSGEVAAQALYLGQALVARDPNLSKMLKKSALEEKDHLRWCKERILSLGGRTSYFNPVWATGSFIIGATAGIFSDKVSLGFLAETETQVMRHLDSHLSCLSIHDLESRAILTQMREDEAHHAQTALDGGGASLPRPVQHLMRFTAKIMTTLAFYC